MKQGSNKTVVFIVVAVAALIAAPLLIGPFATIFVLSPFGVTLVLLAFLAWLTYKAMANFKRRGWLLLIPILFFGTWWGLSYRDEHRLEDRVRRFGEPIKARRLGASPDHVILVVPNLRHRKQCGELCAELLLERHVAAVFTVANEDTPPGGTTRESSIHRFTLDQPENCAGIRPKAYAGGLALRYEPYETVGLCLDKQPVWEVPEGVTIYDSETSPERPNFGDFHGDIVHVTQADAEGETLLVHREHGSLEVLSFFPIIGPAFQSDPPELKFSIWKRRVQYGEPFDFTAAVAEVLGLPLDSNIDASVLPDPIERLDLLNHAASSPTESWRRDAARLIAMVLDEDSFETLAPVLRKLVLDQNPSISLTAIAAVDPTIRGSSELIPAILGSVVSSRGTSMEGRKTSAGIAKLRDFDAAALGARFERLNYLASKVDYGEWEFMNELLAMFDDPVVLVLAELLDSAKSTTVANAASALGELGSEAARRAVPDLLDALESSEGRELHEIAYALAQLDAREQALEVVGDRLRREEESASREHLEQAQSLLGSRN